MAPPNEQNYTLSRKKEIDLICEHGLTMDCSTGEWSQ